MTTALPKATRRWLDACATLGLELHPTVIPAGSKTADEAAAGIGCRVEQIVKSLVFDADGTPVVALVPGDRRLDTELLGAATGAQRIQRATLETVRDATGFAAGGTPPFGHATDVAVYIDVAFETVINSGDETLWIAAGTPDTVAPITHADLLGASKATPVALSR